ncbi:DUF916 domain-containing protein [Desertibacillus haloalkaliphilus]|uniref:DUF916 domain-containing protein n=1 Tax=Desertibacillus haloalkaliphilus TaxID=1328930 RepID=UPI001C25D40C|nr:DUF916 domain-containing protein [Desertibacillus haloalkaliphilus]MBU8906029.1 DUF916 and DUF3324 domain-containing protein [Desertibacillus haloalkaliphilus]
MKLYRSVLFALLFFTVILTGGAQTIAQQNAMPFSVEPVYPDNQTPGIQGYFSLDVTPEDTQALRVNITNNREEEVVVNLRPANGYTNPRGGMLYETDLDSENTVILSDEVKLAEHIHVVESITIPARETEEVEIELNVPNREEGTLLGGIIFSSHGLTAEEEERMAQEDEEEASFSIRTETAIAMAMQLNFPQSIEPQFSIGEAGFLPTEAQVYIEMLNEADSIQDNFTGEYEVMNVDGDVLFAGEFGPFKMAPSTRIRYPIDWQAETLEPGDYSVRIAADVNQEEIVEQREFTIDDEEIQEYVERVMPDVAQPQQGMPAWAWALIGALTGVILVGIVFIWSRNRNT